MVLKELHNHDDDNKRQHECDDCQQHESRTTMCFARHGIVLILITGSAGMSNARTITALSRLSWWSEQRCHAGTAAITDGILAVRPGLICMS